MKVLESYVCVWETQPSSPRSSPRHFTQNLLCSAKHRAPMRQETLQFQTIIPPPLSNQHKRCGAVVRCWRKANSFLLFFFLQKFLFIFKTPFFSESRSNPFQKLEVRFSHSHKLNIALPLFICWPPPPLTIALNCFVYAHLLHTPSFTHLTSSVTFFVSL